MAFDFNKNNLKKTIDNRPRYLRYSQNFNNSDNRYDMHQNIHSKYSEEDLTDDYENYETESKLPNEKYIRFRGAPRIDNTRFNIDKSNMDQLNNDIDDYRNEEADFNNRQNFNDYRRNRSILRTNNNSMNDYFDTINNPDYSQNYDNKKFSINNRFNSVQYHKRQLPQLQRYTEEMRYGDQYPYWNDYDDYPQNNRKSKYRFSFSSMWQKVVITFTSILSLVCLSWVAYTWKNTDVSANDPAIIEPEKPAFKVLPDSINNDNIPYQDKSIYSSIDPGLKINDKENLMPNIEVPNDIPMDNSCKQCQIPQVTPEEYAIVDEHDYYIKCNTDNDKSIANTQLNLMKKKLNSFSNKNILNGVNCEIKRVINKAGNKDEAILIGPFKTPNDAMTIAQHCGVKGNIITVKKK